LPLLFTLACACSRPADALFSKTPILSDVE
jgi:hypothetical protein